MSTVTETPRIYVACLASYNSGILHGKWIEATDADVIREEVDEMLAESSQPDAEEWAIHDFEGFEGMKIEEYDDFDKIAELAELIEEHGAAYAAYADNVGLEFATASDFEEAYMGEYDSEQAYAEESFDDCNKIPDHLANYIDYEAVTRDWFCGDYYSVDSPCGVYVFRSL
jgi:antirestriction protein